MQIPLQDYFKIQNTYRRINSMKNTTGVLFFWLKEIKQKIANISYHET